MLSIIIIFRVIYFYYYNKGLILTFHNYYQIIRIINFNIRKYRYSSWMGFRSLRFAALGATCIKNIGCIQPLLVYYICLTQLYSSIYRLQHLPKVTLTFSYPMLIFFLPSNNSRFLFFSRCVKFFIFDIQLFITPFHHSQYQV